MLTLKQQDQTTIIDHFKSYLAHTQIIFVFSQYFNQANL